MSMVAMLALTGCARELSQQSEPRAFVVYFENGSTELTPEAQGIVADIASAAQKATRAEVTIEGTAARTADAGNGANLAARRTLAVKDALRAAGVPESSIGLRYTDVAADTRGVVAGRRVNVTLVVQN
jgi:outer membrane protein OmpA-like peptidoglycan-associated protein